MKAYILKDGYHSVLSTELNIGIVLTINFDRDIGGDEAFHVFSTQELAVAFINKKY